MWQYTSRRSADEQRPWRRKVVREEGHDGKEIPFIHIK
jgi:hypothetical protein